MVHDIAMDIERGQLKALCRPRGGLQGGAKRAVALDALSGLAQVETANTEMGGCLLSPLPSPAFSRC